VGKFMWGRPPRPSTERSSAAVPCHPEQWKDPYLSEMPKAVGRLCDCLHQKLFHRPTWHPTLRPRPDSRDHGRSGRTAASFTGSHL